MASAAAPPAAPPKSEQLTASQERFMSIIRDTERNVFLTGDAGTGKTYVLTSAKGHFEANGMQFATVAFTGSAAFNASGTTIHSAFHPLPYVPSDSPDVPGTTLARNLPELLYQLLVGPNHVAHDADTANNTIVDDNDAAAFDSGACFGANGRIDWARIDVLFLDEVSLVDAALFALMDRRLQVLRSNTNPFGGVRLIVAGDFGQIAPLQPSMQVRGLLDPAHEPTY